MLRGIPRIRMRGGVPGGGCPMTKEVGHLIGPARGLTKKEPGTALASGKDKTQTAAVTVTCLSGEPGRSLFTADSGAVTASRPHSQSLATGELCQGPRMLQLPVNGGVKDPVPAHLRCADQSQVDGTEWSLMTEGVMEPCRRKRGSGHQVL